MKILIVSSEVSPFARTRELADVTGMLSIALHKLGHDVRIITPKYKVMDELDLELPQAIEDMGVPISNRIEQSVVLEGKLADTVPVYFLKNDMYYQRDQLYGDSQGDYPDNAERFIYFSRSILEVCKRLNFFPDVLHCHDWQTGLVPIYLRQLHKTDPAFARTASVYTIHNLGYQGLFWHYDMHLTGLGWELFTPDSLEYYGKINLMKGGLLWSDIVSTVSPTYAREIQTREHGHGLEGVLQHRSHDLYGIVSGVDDTIWNPETDSCIARNYSARALSGKKDCKKDLLQEYGLPVSASFPVIASISQLDNQKGFDLIAEVMDKLMTRDLYFVLLGNGHEKYQKLFQHLAEKYSRKLGIQFTYDDRLAHKIQAGADILLMPSRYEPCGSHQIHALKYGTVPIVYATGGLNDTVKAFQAGSDTGTGIKFDTYKADDFLNALETALGTYQKKKAWKALMLRGMAEDFSWDVRAQEYVTLYKKALEKHQG